MISIYCDGSSSGKSDRPGGWCWIVVVDDKPHKMGAGGDLVTTNNRMEMKAALYGLLYVQQRMGAKAHGHLIELVSDSQLTLGLAAGSMEAAKNTDLAKPLREVAKQLGVRFRWVKGHAGNSYNERCDRFAKAEKKKLEALA